MRAVQRWLLCELDRRLSSSRVRCRMVLGIGRVQMHAVCRRDVPEFLGTVFVCTRVRWELCEINRGGGTDGVSDGVVLGIGCDRVLALRRRDRRGDHRLIIVIDGGRRKLRELDWCVGDNEVPPWDYSGSGASECTECDAATYAKSVGSTSCTLSGAGYFVNLTGTSAQVECEAGSSSGSVESKCAPCVLGTYHRRKKTFELRWGSRPRWRPLSD